MTPLKCIRGMDPVPVPIFVILLVVIVVGPFEQIRIPHDVGFIKEAPRLLAILKLKKKKKNYFQSRIKLLPVGTAMHLLSSSLSKSVIISTKFYWSD